MSKQAGNERTIRSISNQASPSSNRALGKANLDLDFAYSVVAFVGVDLTFQRFEDELLVSMGV